MTFQIHTISQPTNIYFKKDEKDGIYSKTVKKQLSELKWIDSTVGNSKTGENIVDNTIRNSFKGNNCVIVEFEYNRDKYNVILDKIFPEFKFKYRFDFTYEGDYIKWEPIRYLSGGFFAKHIDGQKDTSHFATAIIIPPNNFNVLNMELSSSPVYTGGELIVEDTEIIADDSWKLVLIPINTPHELKPVLSGERIIFKSEMNYTVDMKYLMNSKSYNQPIESNLKKVIDDFEENINELKNKILELEDERNSIISGELKENRFIKEIKDNKVIKRTYYYKSWTNEFIVLLYSRYPIPTPEKFDDEDKYTYNLILKHFPGATVRVMNIGGQINLGDSDSRYDILFSTETENIRVKDKDERYRKFENLPVYYNFEEGIIPGNNINNDSVYNDQTYDRIDIYEFTILHIQV
jgi:hypothetical protein